MRDKIDKLIKSLHPIDVTLIFLIALSISVIVLINILNMD